MCGDALMDRITGVVDAHLWSNSCGEILAKYDPYQARINSDPRAAKGADEGAFQPAGVVEAWHAVCRKAEKLF
jgi:hypothetical protein